MADPLDPNKPVQQPTSSTQQVGVTNTTDYKHSTTSSQALPSAETTQQPVVAAQRDVLVGGAQTVFAAQQRLEIDIAKRQVQQSVLGNVKGSGSSTPITKIEWLIGSKKFTDKQITLLRTEASQGDENSRLVLQFYNAMETRDERELIKLFLDHSKAVSNRSSRLSVLVTVCRRLKAGLLLGPTILKSLETSRLLNDSSIELRSHRRVNWMKRYISPDIARVLERMANNEIFLVDDNGQIVSSEYIKKVLDNYYRLHPNRQRPALIQPVQRAPELIAAIQAEEAAEHAIQELKGLLLSRGKGKGNTIQHCDWMTKQHQFTLAERTALESKGQYGQLVLEIHDAIQRGDSNKLLELGRNKEWPNHKTAALIYLARGGTASELRNIIAVQSLYESARAIVEHCIDPNQRNSKDAINYLTGKNEAPPGLAYTLDRMANGDLPLIDRKGNLIEPRLVAEAQATHKRNHIANGVIAEIVESKTTLSGREKTLSDNVVRAVERVVLGDRSPESQLTQSERALVLNIAFEVEVSVGRRSRMLASGVVYANASSFYNANPDATAIDLAFAIREGILERPTPLSPVVTPPQVKPVKLTKNETPKQTGSRLFRSALLTNVRALILPRPDGVNARKANSTLTTWLNFAQRLDDTTLDLIFNEVRKETVMMRKEIRGLWIDELDVIQKRVSELRKSRATSPQIAGTSPSSSSSGQDSSSHTVKSSGNGSTDNGKGPKAQHKGKGGAYAGGGSAYIGGGSEAPDLSAEVGHVTVPKDEPRPAAMAELKDEDKGRDARKDLSRRRTVDLQKIHARRDDSGVHDHRKNNFGERREINVNRTELARIQGNVVANDNGYADTRSSGRVILISEAGRSTAVPPVREQKAGGGATPPTSSTGRPYDVVVDVNPDNRYGWTGEQPTLGGGSEAGKEISAASVQQPTSGDRAQTTGLGLIKIDPGKAQQAMATGADGSLLTRDRRTGEFVMLAPNPVPEGKPGMFNRVMNNPSMQAGIAGGVVGGFIEGGVDSYENARDEGVGIIEALGHGVVGSIEGGLIGGVLGGLLSLPPATPVTLGFTAKQVRDVEKKADEGKLTPEQEVKEDIGIFSKAIVSMAAGGIASGILIQRASLTALRAPGTHPYIKAVAVAALIGSTAGMVARKASNYLTGLMAEKSTERVIARTAKKAEAKHFAKMRRENERVAKERGLDPNKGWMLDKESKAIDDRLIKERIEADIRMPKVIGIPQARDENGQPVYNRQDDRQLVASKDTKPKYKRHRTTRLGNEGAMMRARLERQTAPLRTPMPQTPKPIVNERNIPQIAAMPMTNRQGIERS